MHKFVVLFVLTLTPCLTPVPPLQSSCIPLLVVCFYFTYVWLCVLLFFALWQWKIFRKFHCLFASTVCRFYAIHTYACTNKHMHTHTFSCLQMVKSVCLAGLTQLSRQDSFTTLWCFVWHGVCCAFTATQTHTHICIFLCTYIYIYKHISRSTACSQ